MPQENILWCNCKSGGNEYAEIYIPITLTETASAVSLGSAMCAAVGAGAFANLHEASRAMVHSGRTIEPNPSTHALYAEKYALYKETYVALAPLFQRANSRS